MIQEAIEGILESYGLAYGFGLVETDLPEILERVAPHWLERHFKIKPKVKCIL